MPKQMVEVDVRDGWEIVGTLVDQGSCDGAGCNYFKGAIRRIWHWPSCIASNWLAVEKSGAIILFDSEPRANLQAGTWTSASGSVSILRGDHVPFSLPPGDWTESKRKNPNLDAKGAA